MEIATLGLEVKSDGVVTATDRLKRLDGAGRDAESMAGRLSRAALAAGAALAAAFSVRAISQYADQWSDMQSRVGAAIKDMEAAPAMMQRMVDLANASYSPLSQTVEIYARNVGVLSDLGIAAEGAADFTEALNHALVITATRGQRAESVQNALSKAMAVGKLQAEGLETILANGGRVAEALADELGTTVSGLRTMASEGKITGDVIANALLRRLEELRAEAGEMPATMEDAFVRIQTNVMALVGRMDQAVGASESFASALIWVADAIGRATPLMVALAELVAITWGHVTSLAGSLIDMLSPAIGLIIDNMGILIGAFATFMAIKIVIFLGTAAGAMIHFARTVRTLGLVMAAVTSLTRLKMTAILLLGGAIAQVTGTTEVLIGWIEDLGRSIYNALPEDMRTGIDGVAASLAGLGNEIEGLEGGRTFHELDRIARDAAGSVGEVGKAVSGVSAATAAANDNLTNMARIGQQVTQTLASGFSDIFKRIVTGSGNAMEAVGQLLSRLGDVFINNAFQMLFGGLFGGMFGGGGNIMTSLGPRMASFTPGIGWMSMEGGGFTGYGPRSGGIDGRGGLPAILHPNETVIDHTLAANANRPVASTHTSGGDVYVTIERIEANSEAEGAAAARGFQAEMRRWQESGEGARYVRAVVNNPGRSNPRAA